MLMKRALFAVATCTVLLSGAGAAQAVKVFLNPSNQTGNPVTGGGNEAQYALIVANLAQQILTAAGYDVRVDQDFTNSPPNANSWGADIFVSIHTNAGGGHGTEVLYKSAGGRTLADHVLQGLLGALPYQSRGLKFRDDLYVLNATSMYAALAESLFHDCARTSGYQGHPPSETDFLRSAEGQQAIAAGIAAGVCTYFGGTCAGGGTPTGLYRGVVYRAPDTADRIVGAVVTLGNGESTTTSDTGYFQFLVPAGTYTATAAAPGFQPNSSTRDVPAGGEIWGSIGLEPAAPPPDRDGDGVPDAADNCPDEPNPDQADADGDGVGDACEPPPDRDGDGVPDRLDNCPGTWNPDQADSDGDRVGDACEPPPDADGDGVPDDEDNCPGTWNADQTDSDGDGVGDACEPPPPEDVSGGEPDGVGAPDVPPPPDVPQTPDGAPRDVSVFRPDRGGAPDLPLVRVDSGVDSGAGGGRGAGGCAAAPAGALGGPPALLTLLAGALLALGGARRRRRTHDAG
jgi:hypothetical protein